MATFVEIRPVEHDDKKTTFVRIDDDLRVTTRIEEVGKSDDDSFWNFTGVTEGDYLTGAEAGGDPIAYVNVTKLGTDARAVISVNAYYAANEATTVPNAGIYWYPWKTQVDREPFLRVAKGEEEPKEGVPPLAPDISEGQVQTFPVTIFNISDNAVPGANTAAVSFTQPSLYTRLGSLENRRNHLKALLRNLLDHPDQNIWLAGVVQDYAHVDFRNPINTYTNRIFTQQMRWVDRIILLQMWANVISINDNLNTEQKFNLINGNLSLDPYDMYFEPSPSANTGVSISSTNANVSNWTFKCFGTVGSSSPWTYTRTNWNLNTNSIITMTGAALGNTWPNWVRS